MGTPTQRVRPHPMVERVNTSQLARKFNSESMRLPVICDETWHMRCPFSLCQHYSPFGGIYDARLQQEQQFQPHQQYIIQPRGERDAGKPRGVAGEFGNERLIVGLRLHEPRLEPERLRREQHLVQLRQLTHRQRRIWHRRRRFSLQHHRLPQRQLRQHRLDRQPFVGRFFRRLVEQQLEQLEHRRHQPRWFNRRTVTHPPYATKTPPASFANKGAPETVRLCIFDECLPS